MEGHLWKQVQSLPSFSDVLKLSYLQRASESDKQTILLDDQRCKKCQSFWTNGQFSLKIKPANQKRKLRRKHLIKKYSVIIKESLNQKYIKNLKKIIQRLQRLNNHWAIYTCLLCSNRNEILLFKPVFPKHCSREITQNNTKQDIVQIKDKKKKVKKLKTCGLTINMQPATHSNNKQLKKGNTMLQLANMLKSNARNDLSNKLKQL